MKRVVLCSGKVYYDLAEARKKSEDRSVAIVRLEQFYPFPLKSIREMLAKYPNATELVWAQEEPQNMGGWTFIHERLENLAPRLRTPAIRRALCLGKSRDRILQHPPERAGRTGRTKR